MSLRQVKHRLTPSSYKKKFGMKTTIKRRKVPKRKGNKSKRAAANNRSMSKRLVKSTARKISRSRPRRRLSRRSRRTTVNKNSQTNNTVSNLNTSFGDFILELFS